MASCSGDPVCRPKGAGGVGLGDSEVSVKLELSCTAAWDRLPLRDYRIRGLPPLVEVVYLAIILD